MTLVALFAMTTGAWADDLSESFTTNTGASVYTGEHFKITPYALGVGGNDGFCIEYNFPATIEALNGEKITKVEFTGNDIEDLRSDGVTVTYNGNVATVSDVNATSLTIYAVNYIYIRAVKVYYTAGPEVTTNAASEGATFTEASFQMPAFDATAEYELVRDMGYKVAFSGVPTRARLAKDGNGKFHFADGLTFQLLDNIDAANPKDITSAEGITFMVGEVVPFDFEGSTFYQLDKETLVPLADFLADAHLGTYAICAVASTGEYDGSFSSGMITLFQGYEVEVAAKEFITYYKDEPLYADTETSADAELYTITSVSADQATLSAAIETAPSLTPLLIFNNSDEAKTFLLIPANEEPNLALTVAPEFQGTLTARDFTADDMAAADYYTLSGGKIFVPVYEAGTIAANKCWLQFNHQQTPGARTITLVFGDDATGINSMVNGQWPMDTWYDLNGRKLDKMPTKKGIYIKNGKKVVVR